LYQRSFILKKKKFRKIIFINQNQFIMKKILFFFCIICFIFSAHAGYIVKGKVVSNRPDRLINYTLTLDQNGAPLSAGTTNTNDGGGYGLNTIIIIDTIQGLDAVIFPFTFGQDEHFNIEVRDFYYDKLNELFVLCGSRTIITPYGNYSHAFIAEIDTSLSFIKYIEHPEVEVYYSVCVPNDLYMDYYTCGKSGDRGAICSIRRSDLQLMNFYSTDIKWEYHKIVKKPNTLWAAPSFFISGRNPECTHIGFTILSPSFMGSNYVWEELSEPEAHCVITDYTLDNRVVIASSYGSSVTLNPIPIPVSPFGISAYRFRPVISSLGTRFCVQDIGMFEINDVVKPRISVAGYILRGLEPIRSIAWHGYVLGLSSNSTMQNNYYFGNTYEWYKHYKIKRTIPGKEYTGGDFQGSAAGITLGSALFGTPLTPATDCDHLETFPAPAVELRYFTTFNLISKDISERWPVYKFPLLFPLLYAECTPFKSGDDAPEYSMHPPKNETEITNFYDRIAVKDTPSGTNYQIYSITGQLIQTGTTNPDISTANLSKGMYILRLEDGKAVKFVK
jgi:hypothetical protein